MKKYYYGKARSGPYFEGWYLKFQTKTGESLALIPALHIDRAGRRSASLQVISSGGTWWLEYPDTAFSACERAFEIRVGQTVFTENSASINIENKELSLHGTIHYGPFLPLSSDIMGPFRFLPGMECSHGVISMAHPLEGCLTLNGEVMDFSGGIGYVETDRGCSFPSAYLWTQCAWQASESNSIMMSVATIPMPVGSFSGCICAVMYHGREYRLASYRGAGIERWTCDGATIRQGKYRLEAELLEGTGHPLRAPVDGSMARTIRESLSAKLRYRFWIGKELLLDHTDSFASFECAGTGRK